MADFLTLAHGLLPSTEAVEDLVRRTDASGTDAPTLLLEMGGAKSHGGGAKQTIAVDRLALLAAMDETLDRIAGVVADAWDALPEQTRIEVRQSGLWLTGGGARLRLVVERMARATSLVPNVPKNPLHAVITGASRLAISG